VALMNLAMIAVHLPAPAHHHGGAVAVATGQQPSLMGVATMVSAIEVTLAVAVLVLGTRRRGLALTGER
jgi:hypothetical protein